MFPFFNSRTQHCFPFWSSWPLDKAKGINQNQVSLMTDRRVINWFSDGQVVNKMVWIEDYCVVSEKNRNWIEENFVNKLSWDSYSEM